MEPLSNPSSYPIIYPLPSILEPIDLSRIFPRNQPLDVELGSGDGSFLVDYAAMHPNKNFVGVERLLGRLRKIERKGRRRALENLRAVRIECVYFTRYLLPKKSVSAFHIYFPDPWPKRRHRQNRLINQAFPTFAHEALADGGTVYLRTDDSDYFLQMCELFGASPFFEKAVAPADLLACKTDFESDFSARGIPTLDAAFRMR